MDTERDECLLAGSTQWLSRHIRNDAWPGPTRSTRIVGGSVRPNGPTRAASLRGPA